MFEKLTDFTSERDSRLQGFTGRFFPVQRLHWDGEDMLGRYLPLDFCTSWGGPQSGEGLEVYFTSGSLASNISQNHVHVFLKNVTIVSLQCVQDGGTLVLGFQKESMVMAVLAHPLFPNRSAVLYFKKEKHISPRKNTTNVLFPQK